MSVVEEKDALLPTPNGSQSPTQSRRLGIKSWSLAVAIILVSLGVKSYRYYDWYIGDGTPAPTCPQVEVLNPVANGALWTAVNEKIGTSDFKADAVDWLAGAVRVRTESYDNMPPVGQDPRWEVFGPFHDYLVAAFPLVHFTLSLTKVNTYGLHYEWKGSDPSLQPILLAGHQDVVPVDATSVDQWNHPPYSGYFDGERMWGRGSSDDKSGLIGILTAIETLIDAKFKPTRTVVLSFGFDEECSGPHGAGHLGPHLESVYGKNGFAMIVDEGSGFGEQYGSVFASPGIAEKGSLNVRVEVSAPGGHSSIPPKHTSIGILSALLVHYEKNPHKAKIEREEPMYQTLQCIAQHGRDVPEELRSVIQKSAHSKAALKKLRKFVRKDRLLRSLVGTTQAIDLIHGGVKSNALPEQAWAVVNHRISVMSSVDELRARDTALLQNLARKFNLTYDAFGSRISEEGAPSRGSLAISDAYPGTALEPAPVTPTGKGAAPYQLLSGTIKATFNAHRSLDDADSIIVAPSLMTGNTDTRYYWDLSRHIFRYNHHNGGNNNNNIHTVNEAIEVDNFLEMIRFFTTLILNADESKTI